MRDETDDEDTFNQTCMSDLTRRTGLNPEQLCQMVLGLDISAILADNRILNILGLIAFKNFDALCLAYVRHVEECLCGVFENYNELFKNVRNTIRNYTCPVGWPGDCQGCFRAVCVGHLWCLK
jgi:hypothetical protein